MAKSNKKHIAESSAKKALLRLKKGKGSVLFLVVAIMSVMVILASAVYYSVSSARKQVEVKYDSQQAYQSALALNDLVINFINIKNDDAFVQSIIDLNQNESLVTKSGDGSGFSQLAGGLGNYKVTVKKVKGDASEEIHVLEIEVDIDVNGEKSTISTVGEFKVKSQPYNFDRFFTSTGYAPNDVIFKNMNSANETIYLDNEFTQFGGDDGHNTKTLNAEIITAGTIKFDLLSQVQQTEFTIGNNCYIFSHNGFSFPIGRVGGSVMLLTGSGANITGGPLYILEDFYLGTQESASAIYVNGDMVINTGMTNPVGNNIYVNGDLFLNANIANQLSGITVGGNIYCYIDDNTTAPGYTSYCGGKVYNLKTNIAYSKDGTEESFSTDTFDYTKYMLFNLASRESFDSDEKLRANLDYIESYCGTEGGAWANIWPSLNGTCEDIATVKQRINEKIGDPEYINWDLEEKFITTTEIDNVPAKTYAVDSSKLLNINIENDKGTVIKATTENDYYVIQSVKGGSSRSSLIFDTFMGDYSNAAEVADKTKYANMFIYLEPNCYVETTTDEWGNKTTKIMTDDSTKFDSFTWDTTEGSWGIKFILTRGMGSVTFVVPEGVRYIHPNDGYVGHMAVLEQMEDGLKIPATYANGNIVYGSFPKDKMPNGLEDKMKNMRETNAMGTSNVIKQSIINQYNNPNDPARAFYIHNNVFLATISKNAIMDFSGSQNMYAGFVYAPYMTYNSEGVYAQQNSNVFGGMIVSDFIQSRAEDVYVCTTPYDYYDRYVKSTDSPAKQEKTRVSYMEKLMADSGCTQILSSSTSRTWRKYGYN